MDSCTLNLRILLCSYLPVAELYRGLILVNKHWYSAFSTTELLKELLRVNIGLSDASSLPPAALHLILRLNSPGCFPPTRRPLRITGFGITGGDDLLSEAAWRPAFLFSKEADCYCTASNGNSLCAGILSEAFGSAARDIETKARDCLNNDLLPCSRRELLQEVDVREWEDPKVVGCVHGFYVSRRGVFSCPLSSFLLLTSSEKVDLASDFSPFFDLFDSTDVFNRFRSDIVHVTTHHNYETIEFRPVSSRLQPVVWGKFIGKRCTTIKGPLAYRYLGRYFYVLMIAPENRMRQFGDFHSLPNIDVHSVLFYGRSLHLYA